MGLEACGPYRPAFNIAFRCVAPGGMFIYGHNAVDVDLS